MLRPRSPWKSAAQKLRYCFQIGHVEPERLRVVAGQRLGRGRLRLHAREQSLDGISGHEARDRPVDRHRHPERDEVDEDLPCEVARHRSSSSRSRLQGQHPSRIGPGGVLVRHWCGSAPTLPVDLQMREHVDARHLPVVPPRGRRVLAALGRRPVGPVLRVEHRPHAVVPERNRGQILQERRLQLRHHGLVGLGVGRRCPVELLA